MADSQVTQVSVRTLSQLSGDLAISRLSVRALSPFEAIPSRISREAVRTLSSISSPERLSRLGVRTLSEYSEVEFSNATIFVGITWIEVTTRTGAFYVWSDRQLPDPSWYYGGWKEPRVITWGRIRRSLSGFEGHYETTDFTVTLSDVDRVVRGLDNANELLNATVVVRMITDEERRNLGVPRVAYRGVIKALKPKDVLEYELTVKDPFAEQFSTGTVNNTIPRRTVSRDDFIGCTTDLVPSSAHAYTVGANAAIGVSQVTITGGYGQYAAGDKLVFSSHSTIYTVSEGSWTDPETFVKFSPALTNAVVIGETITQTPTHKVEPAVGKRGQIWYGHLTDYLGTGTDTGDGPAPAMYVEDVTLPDGKVYAHFVWAFHACYSPSGKPIRQLYFFNNALDHAVPATALYINGIQVPISYGDLATEAGSGGRIVMPGYASWTAMGWSHSYEDINANRYTSFYLGGIFRDWALGITKPPDNLGGVPMSVDGYGCDSVGDGTGSLIVDEFAQYLHIVKNWCPPVGDGYHQGAWLATPQYPDGTPMVDEASFATAQTLSKTYVSTTGFRGFFGIGVNNESVNVRDLLARLNISCGCESGFNRKSQYFVSLVNRTLATTVQQPELDYVRDIFSSTFVVDEQDKELFTAINYRATQDYFKRAAEGWRSALSGDERVVDATAEGIYGVRTEYKQMFFYMLRGKNRSSDPDEYVVGTDTINAVLAIKLARLSYLQRLPKFQIGPAGFNYELGDVLPCTHYEGVSSTGWVKEPVRIERLEYDPTTFTCYIEGYQEAPLLVDYP